MHLRLCAHYTSHLSPLTLTVVGAPRMTMQQVSPGESLNPIPAHSMMLSCHLFFCLPLLLFLSLSFDELSSPCQRMLRCGHTIWVSISSPWNTWWDHYILDPTANLLIHHICVGNARFQVSDSISFPRAWMLLLGSGRSWESIRLSARWSYPPPLGNFADIPYLKDQ